MTDTPKEAPPLTPYDLFLMKHMTRVTDWINHHKEHQKLPIEYSDETGFRWLNRAERRKRTRK